METFSDTHASVSEIMILHPIAKIILHPIPNTEGYTSCCCIQPGRCGEKKTPSLCSFVEGCCCNAGALEANQRVVMDRYGLRADRTVQCWPLCCFAPCLTAQVQSFLFCFCFKMNALLASLDRVWAGVQVVTHSRCIQKIQEQSVRPERLLANKITPNTINSFNT